MQSPRSPFPLGARQNRAFPNVLQKSVEHFWEPAGGARAGKGRESPIQATSKAPATDQTGPKDAKMFDI